MMYINRYLFETIKKIKKSLLLLGPRQTGKSTLIAQLKPTLTINLADEETFVEHLRNPGLIKALVKSHRKIFVDEIQRIPSLLNTIQTLIDSDKSLQFLLTGSSARKLKRGQANLLPGRIVTYELGPLNLLELSQDFQLSRALSLGLLPGIYLEQNEELAKKILRSYATVYLREEIQAEALTKNLEGFSRFISVVTSRSGDILDFTKVAKEASIERMTARRYYDILIDTLLVTEVPPFAKSSKRRLIQHPKFYLFDVGVLNGFLGNFSASQDRMGLLFEHLVLQLIQSASKSKDEIIRISTYRTEADAEVDFIIERGREVFAVEVKSTKKIDSTDIRGLKSFADFYSKKHEAMIIYQGSNRMEINGVKIFPIHQAMEYLGY